jgi:hypothetical protein
MLTPWWLSKVAWIRLGWEWGKKVWGISIGSGLVNLVAIGFWERWDRYFVKKNVTAQVDRLKTEG